MKKLFSLILALTLVMSMGVTAFAAEGDQSGVQPGSYNANVTGTVTGGSAGEAVYSVDIKWSGLSFTYRESSREWDATNHKYNTVTEGWDNSGGKITVTNHSNAAITATPTWTAGDDYKSVGMDFEYSNGTDALQLASAETTKAAVEETIKVAPNGTLASSASGTKIGLITITLTGEGVTATTVYSETALKNALANGDTVRLGNDIECREHDLEIVCDAAGIDLNGYSLKADVLVFAGKLQISGGSFFGGLYVGEYAKLSIGSGDFVGLELDGVGDIVIEGGRFGFDPTEYVDLDNYTVTCDGGGTYTVTDKTD